ncbi:hypothetical protein FCIRC_6390 [Fusarium circinatum]|uniref:Uncharacterized protein n=1 Tax=Fusarium circinatum TaxID=48490 RepID=A0A8H5TUT6_FUSCI|nr:hypothetical protein FCIRC_6390 [Fusarium circinatum]
MTPNKNDKDTMEHGRLPNTTEIAQSRTISDNPVPSPGTTPVQSASGTNLDNGSSGQNASGMRGSTFHGAMGFSRGLGWGGIVIARGRGGRGNSGPGRGAFDPGRGRGQLSRGRGTTHSSRGGVQKAPRVARPADASKSAERPNNEVVQSISALSSSQATTKSIPMRCELNLNNEEDRKKYLEMAEYARFNKLSFRSEPLRDNANELARRRRLDRIMDMDDNAPVLSLSHGGGHRKAKEQSSPVESSDEPGMECIACGSKTHSTEWCLDGPSGNVPLCILCPSLQHNPEDCTKMSDMSLTEKVRIFVDGRANLPPLDAKVPWWDLLYTWLNDESSKGEALPTRFPWSQEFAKEIAHRQRGRYVMGLQAEFDSSGHDREMLPKDATTSTLDAVYVNHVAKEGATWIADFAKRMLGGGGHNGST